MSYLMTVTGSIPVDALGMILPHEHVVTDLRPPDTPGFGEVVEAEVVAAMTPYIEAARQAGVTALIECTPAGVGRNVRALRALSRATSFPIVASAGTYRDQLIPEWIRVLSDQEMDCWLRGELTVGIDGSDVLGGLIKLAVTDTGITPLEERVLRAAGRVGAELGVTVASHTVGGRLAVQEAELLAAEGLPAERFVWVHAQTEPDMGYHRALAQRGCYLEYDGIGEGSDPDAYIRRIRGAFGWGLGSRVLLSQDAGWYRPGEPSGGEKASYDFLPRAFLPLLVENGFTESDIRLLTEENVKRAFARG